jgi:peptidoglycan/LPS O-acetylase OafA/YrhL
MLPSQDIKPLTGIRFFAAFWVVLFHFREQIPPVLQACQPFMAFVHSGHYAVPLFFILSGFVLSHTYFHRYTYASHAEFVSLRFARLWPVHLATLLFLVLLTAAFAIRRGGFEPGELVPFSQAPAELGMVRCWWSKDLILNYPAWSIQSEWFAYIFVFPLAFALFRSMRSVPLLLLGIVVVLVAHCLLPLERLPGKCFDILLLFLAGSALYRLRLLLRDSQGSLLVYVAFGAFLAGLFLDAFPGRLFLHLSFALLLFGLSYEHGFVARFLSLRVVVYGGAISYSLYMTHALVLKVSQPIWLKLGLDGPWFGTLNFVGILGLTILGASACHHWIEVPCNRLLRSRLCRACVRGNSLASGQSLLTGSPVITASPNRSRIPSA